jgi:hypothetical protein
MKKQILGLLAALLLVVGLVSAVTTVDTTWNGGGTVSSIIDASGNQKTTFGTGGNVISGHLIVSDAQDNPYSYGVSSVSSYLTASVSGGFLDYVVDRTNSYAYMYGASGQGAFTHVGADTGSEVAVATGANSNYASMGVGTYAKPHTLGGYNFQGLGNVFINHGVMASDGDGAGFIFNGASGTVGINAMSSDMGATGFTFGKGAGCYTNANVLASGIGSFEIGANSGHAMSGNGWSITGPSAFAQTWTFGSGLSVSDFSLAGN